MGWAPQAEYTTKLEAALPAFLELFDDDGSKYFAQLYFAWLRNSRDEKGIETTRVSRLTALANRLPSIKFSSKRERKMSAIILLNLQAVSEEVETLLTEDLSAEAFFDAPELNLNVKLLGWYLASQLQQQKFESVQAKWKAINQFVETHYPGGLRVKTKNDLESLASIISSRLERLLTSQTPEEIVKLLPVLRDLNNPSYRIPLDPNTLIKAHLLAGRHDELEKFMQEKRELSNADTEAPLSSNVSLYELIAALKDQLNSRKRSDPKAAIVSIPSVWKFAQSQGFSLGTPKVTRQSNRSQLSRRDEPGNGIEQLANSKLLTDKQILELGPKLAEINSYNGQIWLQLGRRQAAAGQNRKAAVSFKKSLEEASDVTKSETFNRRLEYAFVLVALKRKKEAKELIQDITAEALDFKNQGRFRMLEQRVAVEDLSKQS